MTVTSTAPELSTLTGTWSIDPAHSSLGFAVKHAMVTTVRGRFSDFDGTLVVDAEDPTRSSATVDVRLASVDTRNDQRDAHLRSADFFDTDAHPVMSFRSTGATVTGDDEYVLRGDLTIKGVTKPVDLALTYTGTAVDAYGNQRLGFEGSAQLNRKDWGLSWNVALEAGGLLVSEKVKLVLDIAAVRAS